MNSSFENRAKLACLYAGGVWGLFWIPLRALEEAGINGLWVTFVYFLVPTIFLIPVGIWRLKYLKLGGFNLQLTGMLSGGALMLYATSIVYTDVVRAMLLFYLTPVWGTILGRLFLNENITPLRIFSMIIAIIGMLTIFGLGVKFPIPQNVGDWMGVASGLLWAVASTRIRLNQNASAIDMTIGFFFWATVFSILIAMALAPNFIPIASQVLPALPILLIFVILFILPGTLATLWGPKFLNPGLVGLLFMTEIVVGSISVALLAGETFGIREIIGIVLISSASMFEPVISILKNK
ncbi:DMT family transporter [Amylibacter sp.]|nr:DMT family transporter [Amylibacter sp.]